MPCPTSPLTYQTLECRTLMAADLVGYAAHPVSDCAVGLTEGATVAVADADPWALEQVVTRGEIDQMDRAQVAALLDLQAFADLSGAAASVIRATLAEAKQALLQGKSLAETTAAAEKALVVSGLGLPSEALQTELSGGGLLNFAASLQSIGDAGDGLLHDANTYRRLQRDGSAAIDAILSEAIGAAYGLPSEGVAGLGSQQLLEGIAVAESMGASSALGTLDFWRDWTAAQGNQNAAKSFAEHWSGADSRTPDDNAAPDAERLPGVELPDLPGTGATPSSPSPSESPAAAPSEPSESATNEAQQGDDDDWISSESQPQVIVTYTEDGGFDVDVYDADGNHLGTEHFTDNGDGAFSGDRGGSSTFKPTEGAHGASLDEDGDAYVPAPADDDADATAGGGSSGGNSTETADDDADEETEPATPSAEEQRDPNEMTFEQWNAFNAHFGLEEWAYKEVVSDQRINPNPMSDPRPADLAFAGFDKWESVGTPADPDVTPPSLDQLLSADAALARFDWLINWGPDGSSAVTSATENVGMRREDLQ